MPTQAIKNNFRIFKTIEPMIKNVHINEDALLEFSKVISRRDLNDLFSLDGATEEEQIAFAVIYPSINCCYWGEPKWTIEIGGQKYDGAIALYHALRRATEKYDILNPEYLKNLPKEDLNEILKGTIEIPLFAKRLEILRSVGQVVNEKFDGSFKNIVIEAGGDAVKIVELLAKEMPLAFNDVANHHGHEIKFYKKAQLVPSHLNQLYKHGLISVPLVGYENLTAFADYKIPQLLRHFGILEYSQELAHKIDNKIEIESGSDEEIEIRASTVWAVELLTRILKQKYPDICAAEVDNLIWYKSQENIGDIKPYHRTRTTWY